MILSEEFLLFLAFFDTLPYNGKNGEFGKE